MQDKLIGALIGLARATDGNEHLISASSTAVILESLAFTMGNVNSDRAMLEKLIQRVGEEKRKMVPNCFSCASPCGRTSDYDMQYLLNEDEESRRCKELILSGIQEIAAHVHCAASFSYEDDEVNRFIYKALVIIGIENLGTAYLSQIIAELDALKKKLFINPC